MKRLEKQVADVQGLAANRERKESGIKKLCYDNNNWAGTYDPAIKVMLGGVSIDGKTFDNDFKITEVEEENAQDALKYCVGLFVEYGTIAMSYNELKKTYDDKCRREAELHSCEECFWEK